MSIILPPLPEPSLPTHARGQHFTADQLRARDQEIARLVLEAAAKECEKRERVIGELHADQKPGTEAFWMVQGVMSASRRNAEHIRALEVRHHE